jgi:hypothetical protein
MEDFRSLGQRLSNWGRRGTGGRRDERGNQPARPEREAAAAALVRDGTTFDFGIPFGADGPQPDGGRINPVLLRSETEDDQNFVVAPPITFRRSFGSPVNPLAIK